MLSKKIKNGREFAILNKTDKTSVYCMLEIKKHNAKDGKDQLKSYTNATGAPLAVWTDENGERKLDTHNHLIQKHDLKDIAEAFAVWAKEQKLSFWEF